MPPLQRYVIALTGGLQDSKALPEPGDLTELYNFSIFRGRFALRAPVSEVADFSGEANPSDSILDMETHLNQVYVLGYDSAADIVRLYAMDLDGSNITHKVDVWTAVTSIPKATIVSFSGGTDEAPQDRLYIADYDQNEVTKYWVDSLSSLNTVSEDWDADSVDSDASFSLMAPYQFHLWGTGFFEGLTATALRPELLRFSQPGLIEATDPAGGNNPKEWFTLNHRSVGRRGDKLKAISYAQGNMIVFQSRSTHAIFGYGQDSWATKQLSDNIGCVGPHAAAASDEDGLCYFWSHDGPYVTDGSTVKYIGQEVQQRVIEAESNDRISASFSPEDGLIYFIFPSPGDPTDPNQYLAFDTVNKRWAEGQWLRGSSTPITVNVAKTISSREILLAPGPQSTPTSLTASVENLTPGDLKVRLGWSSGDLALDTYTEIYRDGASPATTLLYETTAGVILNYDASVTHRQDYYYRIRHRRNLQYSNYSNEVNVRTPCEWLNQLDNADGRRLSAVPHSTGATVHFDNPLATGEIHIQRANADQVVVVAWHGNPIEGSGSYTFSDVTTLANQAAGAGSYTDSTVTEGRKYVYRARVEQAGEDPGGWSQSNVVTAGFSGGTSPTITSENLTVRDSGKGYMKITAGCQVSSEFNFEVDEVRLYVGWDGAFPSAADGIFKGNGFWTYAWSCPHPEGYTTLQLKWELWQGGTQLADTATSSLVTPCSTIQF